MLLTFFTKRSLSGGPLEALHEGFAHCAEQLFVNLEIIIFFRRKIFDINRSLKMSLIKTAWKFSKLLFDLEITIQCGHEKASPYWYGIDQKYAIRRKQSTQIEGQISRWRKQWAKVRFVENRRTTCASCCMCAFAYTLLIAYIYPY